MTSTSAFHAVIFAFVATLSCVPLCGSAYANDRVLSCGIQFQGFRPGADGPVGDRTPLEKETSSVLWQDRSSVEFDGVDPDLTYSASVDIKQGDATLRLRYKDQVVKFKGKVQTASGFELALDLDEPVTRGDTEISFDSVILSCKTE